MKFNQVAGCCTGRIAHSFGQSRTAQGYYDPANDALTESGIKAALVADARQWREQAFLMVTTNNEQKMLNKVLRTLGFEHSTWMSKRQHSDTQVRIWWKHIPTLIKENDNVAKSRT